LRDGDDELFRRVRRRKADDLDVDKPGRFSRRHRRLLGDFRPALGRIIQMAPFGFSESFSFSSRESSAALVASTKIASLSLTTRPTVKMGDRRLELLQECLVGDAERGDAPAGRRADFLQPRRRMLNLFGPLRRRRAEGERGGARRRT
jgi:hypothetical protein